ncbi:MAG: type 1 glutamine amidotransferase [Actinomycetota bacterium]
MRPVAIVQHESSVPPGSIADALTVAGIEHYVFEAWHETQWPTPDDVSALIVLGGTMNVDELERYPFLRTSRELMTATIERGVPTLGVCLGSQMMARILGAEVFRASPRNALFSPLDVSDRDDPVVAPFANGTPVLQFHEDTFKVPSDAVPLATSTSSGLAQAFRYGENAYAIQFHFEVDRAIIEAWCDEIGERSLKDDWGTTKQELLAQADRYIEHQYAAGMQLLSSFIGTTTAVRN